VAISLKQLPQALRNVGKSAERESDRIAREAATIAAQTAVRLTPFKTGHAKANWVAAVNTLSASLPVFGGTGSISAAESASLSRIGVVIAGYSVLRDGDLFVSNNVSYIEDLENGSSQQAPTGMTLHAELAAANHIERARMRLRR
jgi:hypothetical protein